jgi:hypothetical protein
MITYASFCSIFLFNQSPEQDLISDQSEHRNSSASPSLFGRFRDAFGYKQRFVPIGEKALHVVDVVQQGRKSAQGNAGLT